MVGPLEDWVNHRGTETQRFMNWEMRKSLTKDVYTALLDDTGRELGRYWHRCNGFVPQTPNNNAKARPVEAEARTFVLHKVLERYKQDMAQLGLLLGPEMFHAELLTEGHRETGQGFNRA